MKNQENWGKVYPWVLAALAAETDDCITWPFAKAGRGYGVFCKDMERHYLHVFVCEKAHGPKPSPLHEAAHKCGNSACGNKRHVRWLTHAENEADKIAHGTNPSGERNPQAKLTSDQVKEIRELRAGGAFFRDIAPRFGVTWTTIQKIINGQTWRTQ